MAYEDYGDSDGGSRASNGVSSSTVPLAIRNALKPRKPMSAGAAGAAQSGAPQTETEDASTDPIFDDIGDTSPYPDSFYQTVDDHKNHPSYGPLQDSEDDFPDYSTTSSVAAPIGPEIGPLATNQQRPGVPRSDVSKGASADNGAAPSASDVSSGVGNLPGTESGGPPPLIMDAANQPAPRLAQGNKFLSLIEQATGIRGPQPQPGQPYQGPITAGDKAHGVAGFLSRLSESYNQNFGTPLDRDLAMKRRELENEAGWRAGMLGINRTKAETGVQNADINQQKADTQENLATARIPLFGAQANEAQAKTDKTRFEVEQMQQGMFPLDPMTAQLVNRPDLAGKAVSAPMWTALNKVLTARGLKAVDLGNDGYWVIDRGGNKVNQISAVGPSIARAMAFNQNKPVQVIDSRGNLVYSTAGSAIQNGYAPAGPGASAMGKNAQLQDIYSGIGSMKAAIVALPSDEFSTSQLAKLQSILREPDDSLRATLWTNFVGSENLAPEEQDFVVALQQLRERALSVRNLAAMGVGSDTQRAQVLNSLPGILSGNRQMMLKQLAAFDNFVSNLATGVPHVGSSGATTPIHSAVQSRGNSNGGSSKVDDLVRRYGRR